LTSWLPKRHPHRERTIIEHLVESTIQGGGGPVTIIVELDHDSADAFVGLVSFLELDGQVVDGEFVFKGAAGEDAPIEFTFDYTALTNVATAFNTLADGKVSETVVFTINAMQVSAKQEMLQVSTGKKRGDQKNQPEKATAA
jgi:hypothetical protein